MLGCCCGDKSGRYVESLDVTNGTITITYGKDVNEKIDGSILTIQPLVNDERRRRVDVRRVDQPDGTYADSGGAGWTARTPIAGSTDLQRQAHAGFLPQ